jgi:hypothetical protein
VLVSNFIQCKKKPIRLATPNVRHRLGAGISINEAWNLKTYNSSGTQNIDIIFLKKEDRRILPTDSAVYEICTVHIYSPKKGKFDYESVKNFKDLRQFMSLGQSGAETLKRTNSLISLVTRSSLVRSHREVFQVLMYTFFMRLHIL